MRPFQEDRERLDRERLLDAVHARISLTLKKLLEKRHLYQSETLAFEDLVTEGLEEEFLKKQWVTERHQMTDGRNVLDPPIYLLVERVDLKLFCATCDRLEAFNSAGALDLFPRADLYDKSQPVQVFVFSFLCQSCKSVPEVFIVRRLGSKLTLCGRAPIEHVEVPPFIPKEVQSFYRGGILAYQSGQVLAGNFMLRTVIEQWARLATHLETATEADKVLDGYMNSLPSDFRARFPSMKKLYADLSSDIHGAVGSPELFERAHVEIADHFDARRLFKMKVDISTNGEPADE